MNCSVLSRFVPLSRTKGGHCSRCHRSAAQQGRLERTITKFYPAELPLGAAVKKNKPLIPAPEIMKISQSPVFITNVVEVARRSEIISIGKQRGGVSKWKLRVEHTPMSRERRERFRELDRMRPGSVTYQQLGVRPVPYFYRNPRGKKGRAGLDWTDAPGPRAGCPRSQRSTEDSPRPAASIL